MPVNPSAPTKPKDEFAKAIKANRTILGMFFAMAAGALAAGGLPIEGAFMGAAAFAIALA